MQILHGCTSQRLRRRALRDNLTLDKVLSEARSYEMSDSQASAIEKASTVNAIDTRYRQRPVSASFRGRKSGDERNKKGNSKMLMHNRETRSSQHGDKHEKMHTTKGKCRNCGGNFPHRGTCPAKGAQCYKCEKYNHFARTCLSAEKVRRVSNCKQDSGEFETYSTSSEESVFSVTNGNATKTPFV
ncbi:PREDICTED: uncharacterized protein LOC106805367, partial [Priapulus caudatus]|uniref:Uncharacterized protein LOC106805367 n=1 Tax=Priapulus caudatus TaxID=37621 RepID=A0ABM1DR46_PRICU